MALIIYSVHLMLSRFNPFCQSQHVEPQKLCIRVQVWLGSILIYVWILLSDFLMYCLSNRADMFNIDQSSYINKEFKKYTIKY